MAVGLKVAAANAAIDAVFGVAPSATRRVTLHSAEPTTSNEISGGGYSDKAAGAVTKTTVSGYRRGALGELDYGDPSGAWSATPTHWALRAGAGASAAILTTGTITGGSTPAASTSSVTIASGGVYVEFAIT